MRYWIGLILFLHSMAGADEVFHSAAVPQVVWDRVTPFLMPADHPAKDVLDTLFAKPDVLLSRATMQKAGFKVSKPRKRDNIFFATHKKLKGYFLKFYTDDQGALPDWYNWVQRAQGAVAIRQAIERHGYQKIFSVPRKWIYPIPRTALKPEQKSFILVAEDMHLVGSATNAARWKSRGWITEDKLRALYKLLREERLIDSVYVDNIPFAKDGRIAFIDTEHFHNCERRVPYERLTPRLPANLQSFWTEMIQNGTQK